MRMIRDSKIPHRLISCAYVVASLSILSLAACGSGSKSSDAAKNSAADSSCSSSLSSFDRDLALGARDLGGVPAGFFSYVSAEATYRSPDEKLAYSVQETTKSGDDGAPIGQYRQSCMQRDLSARPKPTVSPALASNGSVAGATASFRMNSEMPAAFSADGTGFPVAIFRQVWAYGADGQDYIRFDQARAEAKLTPAGFEAMVAERWDDYRFAKIDEKNYEFRGRKKDVVGTLSIRVRYQKQGDSHLTVETWLSLLSAMDAVQP